MKVAPRYELFLLLILLILPLLLTLLTLLPPLTVCTLFTLLKQLWSKKAIMRITYDMAKDVSAVVGVGWIPLRLLQLLELLRC